MRSTYKVDYDKVDYNRRSKETRKITQLIQKSKLLIWKEKIRDTNK